MSLSRGEFTALVEEESRVLPDQAPLENFVHHNNLHCFEDWPFEEAVEHVYLNYGRSPYMPLRYYRDKLKSGEIDKALFFARLKKNGFEVTDAALGKYVLEHLHAFEDEAEIKRVETEKVIVGPDGKSEFPLGERGEALWEAICRLDFSCDMRRPDFHANRSPGAANRLLTPLLASLMDQGLAQLERKAESREEAWGFARNYAQTALSSSKFEIWKRKSWSGGDIGDQLFNAFFKDLGVEKARKLIRFHLASLPGWAGMIHKCSRDKEAAPRRPSPLNIYDFLYLRSLFSCALGEQTEIQTVSVSSPLMLKYNVFHFLLWNPSEADPKDVMDLFEKLNPMVLRRVFQQGQEDTYQVRVLQGLKKRRQTKRSPAKYQMFFCIDDREESFRRHLEEASGEVETYGVAGFFGLDMMFQKAGQPRPRRYCPPAAIPRFWIREKGRVGTYLAAPAAMRAGAGFFRSLLGTFTAAPFRALELKAHVFFPRLKKKLSEKARLGGGEIDFSAEGEKEGLRLGYTNEELALRAAGILKGAGLTKDFAPYVFMIGHGHDSFNNPHVAAYRCGACSGANASPNAKIFADAANDPGVRELLKSRHGIDLGDSVFIGGYHDTCSDQVELYKVEKMDAQSRAEIETILFKSRSRNAKERLGKFYQAKKNISPGQALKMAEARSWHVAEPRPELNHATNALTVVGRRDLTKNLFLDRRAFLVSYNPEADRNAQTLSALLGAVVPVCAGINLEYYFSKVDTENYGAGSKTSHNVSGLVGVMNGIRGDLRAGLVWQMVEYHDPLRIMFVIEAEEKSVLKVMESNKQVDQMIRNGWVAAAIINPADREDIKMFKNGRFVSANIEDAEIPVYKKSGNVPSGLSENIPVALIQGEGNA